MTQASSPNLTPVIPKPAAPVATRNKLLYWSLFGVAIFIMLGCALISFAGDLLESGALAFIGAIAAVLLVPVYVGLFLWLDRFEPEPPHLLVAAFVWGAGIAGLFACVLNTVVALIFSALIADQQLAEQLTASISAPIMEETLKGIAVAILFFWRKSEFDGVIDGIIYAGMTALGFAMIENVSYYLRGMNGGAPDFLVTFFVRGLMSPYAHVLFTSMTGIGFGLARQTKSTAVKYLAPIAGWLLAMTLHCMWNTIPGLLGWLFPDIGTLLFFGVYLVIWIPLFIAYLSVIGVSLAKESRLIRTYLLQGPGNNLIYQEDADNAARLLPRLVGNINVLFSQGAAAWQALRRYQHATTALAFYRYRVDGGRMLPSSELENQYIQQIVANRPAAKARAVTGH